MLTDEQQAAVESPHKDTVVIAGAGAGKTRVLIERVKWMLSQGIPADEIVLITFTRKAANEIKERLAAEYGECPAVRMGTFHSLALDFLKEKTGKQLTVVSDYVIADIVARVNRTLSIPVSSEKIDAYRFSRALGSLKENPNTKRAVGVYEGILRNEKAIDFLGMMVDGVEIAAKLSGFHVLVDEAQDTDDLQWKFVAELRKGKTLFAVGDIRQQLYLWRNVNERSFWLLPGQRYYLTSTFRFGRNLALMTNEIAKLSGYRGPEIMPFDDRVDSKIYYSSGRRFESILAKMVGLMQKDERLAILCRYNSQVEQYKDELTHLGVEVSEQVEIDHRLVLSMLQYLADPWSDIARRAFLAWEDSCKLLPATCALSTEAAGVYIESLFSDDTTVEHVLSGVNFDLSCKESLEWWSQNYGSWRIADAVNDFVTRDEGPEYTPGVRVMTVHGSKGLEFEHVFFPLAPSRRFDADEWRVAYVACTRAMRSLHVSGRDNPVADVVKEFANKSALMVGTSTDGGSHGIED